MTSDFFTFQASREHSSYQPTSPKLRPDAPPATSRRRWRYVVTQRRLHRDAVSAPTQPIFSIGESGAMHDIRDNYCILAIFFVSLHCVRRKAALSKVQASLTLLSFALSLHCHSLRTANGKLTTKKRRGKTTGVHTCPISF